MGALTPDSKRINDCCASATAGAQIDDTMLWLLQGCFLTSAPHTTWMHLALGTMVTCQSQLA